MSLSSNDSILPTHARIRRANTLPLFELHSYNNPTPPQAPQQPIRLVVLPDSGVKRWFLYAVGIATILGLIVTVVTIVVK
jgi:hypothetical protein